MCESVVAEDFTPSTGRARDLISLEWTFATSGLVGRERRLAGRWFQQDGNRAVRERAPMAMFDRFTALNRIELSIG